MHRVSSKFTNRCKCECECDFIDYESLPLFFFQFLNVSRFVYACALDRLVDNLAASNYEKDRSSTKGAVFQLVRTLTREIVYLCEKIKLSFKQKKQKYEILRV
jgi:hypothetical protein